MSQVQGVINNFSRRLEVFCNCVENLRFAICLCVIPVVSLFSQSSTDCKLRILVFNLFCPGVWEIPFKEQEQKQQDVCFFEICIATGISVCSLRSALYELVFHKYKYDSGNIYPRIVEFHWVVPFSLVVCCRFMCRTFSEIEEQISELQAKNSAGK